MKVLVIDIGGTHIKVASTDNLVPVKIPSGSKLTPKQMVDDVLAATADWQYDRISLGYPGPVTHEAPMEDPHNLGPGWVGFNYKDAFRKPYRFINDAAMQALGGYKGGRMLFLGTGTGLGSALIFDGVIIPLELAHLPYKKGRTYEEYIGLVGLELRGKKRWRKSVRDIIERLRAAFVADYVLLGGGNAKQMKELPEGVILGANVNAIQGGLKLWEIPVTKDPAAKAPTALQLKQAVSRAEKKIEAKKASKEKAAKASKEKVAKRDKEIAAKQGKEKVVRPGKEKTAKQRTKKAAKQGIKKVAKRVIKKVSKHG